MSLTYDQQLEQRTTSLAEDLRCSAESVIVENGLLADANKELRMRNNDLRDKNENLRYELRLLKEKSEEKEKEDKAPRYWLGAPAPAAAAIGEILRGASYLRDEEGGLYDFLQLAQEKIKKRMRGSSLSTCLRFKYALEEDFEKEQIWLAKFVAEWWGRKVATAEDLLLAQKLFNEWYSIKA